MEAALLDFLTPQEHLDRMHQHILLEAMVEEAEDLGPHQPAAVVMEATQAVAGRAGPLATAFHLAPAATAAMVTFEL